MEPSPNQSSSDVIEETTPNDPAVPVQETSIRQLLPEVAAKQLDYLTTLFLNNNEQHPEDYQVNGDVDMTAFSIIFAALVMSNPICRMPQIKSLLKTAFVVVKDEGDLGQSMRRLISIDDAAELRNAIKNVIEAGVKEALGGLEAMDSRRNQVGFQGRVPITRPPFGRRN